MSAQRQQQVLGPRLQKSAHLGLPQRFFHCGAVMHRRFLRLQQGRMSPTHHLQQGTLGLSRCYTPLKKQRISRSGPLSQQRQQQVLTADIGMPCLLRRPLGALQCRGRPRCKAIVLIHRVSPPFLFCP